MVFNSLTFLVFLSVVVALHYGLRSWTARKAVLTAASYLFYGAWNPPFMLLLAGSTLVDWNVARRMAATSEPASRRRLLLLSLSVNLGLLGAFKYGQFLLDSFNAALGVLGLTYVSPDLGILLPVGISFYTFQTLSYTIDVYRGELEPWPRFLDFALFVSFFPQLVAGPIVRASHFLPQTREPRAASSREFSWGLVLLVTGLFQKVVLADALLAPIVDEVYAFPERAGFLVAWVGTVAFSGQILFDFAGYSTCAIGVALLLGFELPDNFRHPYAAVGFSDFWRRWHISLSTWLRDYLYIPLGGNRGSPRRTQVNLMLTMLLGGLWHGAAWRFVGWGGLHGLYLVGERALRRSRLAGAPARFRGGWVIPALFTYGAVTITWVFFRAETWRDVAHLLGAMSGVSAAGSLYLGRLEILSVAAVMAGTLVWHGWLRNSTYEDRWKGFPPWLRAVLLGAMIFFLLTTPSSDRPFIYFQF